MSSATSGQTAERFGVNLEDKHSFIGAQFLPDLTGDDRSLYNFARQAIFDKSMNRVSSEERLGFSESPLTAAAVKERNQRMIKAKGEVETK